MLTFFFHLDFHLCAKNIFFAAARVKLFLATRSSGNEAIFFWPALILYMLIYIHIFFIFLNDQVTNSKLQKFWVNPSSLLLLLLLLLYFFWPYRVMSAVHEWLSVRGEKDLR